MIDSHENARILFDTTADYYQKRAENKIFNVSSLIFQRRIDAVNDFLGRIRPGGTVLDYGMGPAVFGPPATARGLKYIGIDISAEMVERGKAMNLPNSEFHVGDLETLSAYADKMDGVLAIGLIDYLEHPEPGIAALAKCVRPGGQIILSFRNKFSFPRWIRDVSKEAYRLVGRARPDDRRAFFAPVHEKSFSFGLDLQPQLERLGFHRFDVSYLNCSPLFFNFPLPVSLWKAWYAADRRIASKYTRLMCSSGVMVAERK